MHANRGTSITHPIDVDVVPRPGRNGALGLTFAPGKKSLGSYSGILWDRDVHKDVHDLRHVHGTDVIVNLLREREFAILNIPNLVEASQDAGMRVIRFEIDDVSVPDPEFQEAFEALVDELHALLDQDKTITVHCRGGLGRAGTVAACLLVREGEDPDRAIQRVRDARTHAIETRTQERYVVDYATRLRERRAAPSEHHTTTEPV